MESLVLLIPLSVTVVFVIAGVFWLALKGGQFDDLERPAHDVLVDDDRPRPDAQGGSMDSNSAAGSGLPNR
jgi:cbb3-type cytochrome oxidase maturation protein